jgi:hypothetical protein
MSAVHYLRDILKRELSSGQYSDFVVRLSKRDNKIVRLLKLEDYDDYGNLINASPSNRTYEEAYDDYDCECDGNQPCLNCYQCDGNKPCLNCYPIDDDPYDEEFTDPAEVRKKNELDKLLVDFPNKYSLVDVLVGRPSQGCQSTVYVDYLERLDCELTASERDLLITHNLRALSGKVERLATLQQNLDAITKKRKNIQPSTPTEIRFYMAVGKAFWRVVARFEPLKTMKGPATFHRVVKILKAIQQELDASYFQSTELKQQYLDAIQEEFGSKEQFDTFATIAEKVAIEADAIDRTDVFRQDIEDFTRLINIYETAIESLLSKIRIVEKEQ